MGAVILKTVVFFLAVAGFVSFLRLVFFWMLKTENPGEFCIFISMKGHDEQAEFTLRSAAERSKWLRCHARIYCVDLGMDEETRAVCKTICGENANLTLCTPEELQNYCGDWYGSPTKE